MQQRGGLALAGDGMVITGGTGGVMAAWPGGGGESPALLLFPHPPAGLSGTSCRSLWGTGEATELNHAYLTHQLDRLS